MNIYIVVYYWGEYDDYTEDSEIAFFHEANANKYIAEQNTKNISYRIDIVPIGDTL